ncbi:GTP binding/translation elongation factor [Capsaspora owczarzaki ATCC 30864]|uniref:Translation factor GUF1 homolog, mitochondrial n=1 Tax=Capsaspora owczarzaki (strain ATCC 30864) TaxID=595528 RepID=A0A0D2U6J8_CAPO3|nr:GTP binding/translation elongation factor [Capsaspora owczarzaki ATCC 30864]KJE90781.1 GTP binding/translation elongation factor [Capsaspora owczarzaki ATCC 30864]|eukprot:XP_004348784.1 GTP binding/translation elongation factor [Capsaspora owczarzaki ATCC 30864]
MQRWTQQLGAVSTSRVLACFRASTLLHHHHHHQQMRHHVTLTAPTPRQSRLRAIDAARAVGLAGRPTLRALSSNAAGAQDHSPKPTTHEPAAATLPPQAITPKDLDPARFDMAKYPPRLVRNFSIVAHIDHGKSTLADRLLEVTGTIERNKDNKQVLDKLQVERERGITVKAQSVSMFYKNKGETYLINLIDTPGHVDFSYEVSRSLYACQGCILLVDAAQGIQAQTVANFMLAFDSNLSIVPVLNKIDLLHADAARVTKQMQSVFGTEPEEALRISAKTNLGIDQVLPAIIDRVPPPSGNPDAPPKVLLFDSWYDDFRGVVCLIAVVDGSLKVGEKITSVHSGLSYEILELGVVSPERVSTTELHTGQVGYLITGMRSTSEARIGDTLHLFQKPVEALPGFKPVKPMVFAGVFPMEQAEFDDLRKAIEKLTLNDASVTVHRESSVALGSGFRLGFHGMLHMDVFQQRLEQEYDANVIVTSPSVPFRAEMRDGEIKTIESPAEFPDTSFVKQFQEPVVIGTLVFPEEHLGAMIDLCQRSRGEQVDLSYLDETRVMLKYRLPLCEIVTDFFDAVKGVTSGFGSFDYDEPTFVPSKLVKLDIALNDVNCDALSVILHDSKAQEHAKSICERLAETISRQMFEVAIQGRIHSKVIARATVKALRKNVTAKCYGGDVSRKKKLLDKQKEGKKKMKMIGSVELSKESFLSVISKAR